MGTKLVIFILCGILVVITLVTRNYYLLAISFLSLIVLLIYYFTKNNKDLIKFSNQKDFGELSFEIQHKWYESQIIMFPTILCLSLIIIYFKSYQNLNTILTLQIFSILFFVISFSLLDHFQRRKKNLYKIIISDKELIFLEEITWNFNIQELKRVILTGNEKQLWVESRWSKFTFNLDKLKETDKNRFILLIKSIAIKNKILINNILEQVT
ncbi:MAG: hypothetical protein WAU11_14715 [Ignavibacteriaceae bacterium]